MLNKISMALIDESGTVIPVDEKPFRVEQNLDAQILELWAKSSEHFKSIADEEIRFARKFDFINLLSSFFKDEDVVF